MAESLGEKPARPGIGFSMLKPTEEDKAAGIYTLVGPGDVKVRVTARQLKIMSMSFQDKLHVPQHEMAELGKIMMQAQQGNIDKILENLDHPAPNIPEFIDEPFQYKPLSKPTSIRLIRMLPEYENGMIALDLEEYDVDDHVPSYHCLSYTFGNPHANSPVLDFYNKYKDEYNQEDRYPVACNGRILYIRQNLYDALQQLPDSPGLQVRRQHNFKGYRRMLTDLQVAVVDGDVALVKMNIFRGAELECRDEDGCTALSLAAMLGFGHIVRTLLEAGADGQTRDYKNLTPLDHALTQNHNEVVDLIGSFDPTHVKKQERRNKHLGHSPKIWIDAICINQSDLNELSAQVMMMDRIYSQASHVTVWLGKEDPMGGLAKQTLAKLWPFAATTALSQSNIVPYRDEHPEAYEEAGIPHIGREEWAALAALYLRQNFQRVWCLQEMVLPENVVMYLGYHEIPWHEFMMVTEQLHMLQKKYPVAPSTMFRAVFSAPIEEEVQFITELRMRKLLDSATDAQRNRFFQTTKRFYRGEGKPCSLPLLDMIMSTITLQCSNPRDYIYGILGMCKNHPESPRVQVDYTKSVEEIYTSVMRLLINRPNRSENRLQYIAQIRDSIARDNQALPSWVLDFGQPGIASFADQCYSADGAGEYDTDHSLGESWNELLVEGRQLGRIKKTASERKTKGTVSLLNFDPGWLELVNEMSPNYITGQPRTEVLWRTLCGDQTSMYDFHAAQRLKLNLHKSNVPATAKYASQFRDQLCAMLLGHGERSASLANKIHNTPGGVLFQLLANLNQEQPEGQGGHAIVQQPTNEELERMNDTSLEGPHYSDERIQNALQIIDQINQEDGDQSHLPSRANIEQYLAHPRFRVWNDVDNVPEDTLVADYLPPGEDGFRSMFVRFNGGRRLFLTDKGYLGLGPMSMDIGDEIWILKGSPVPFLLRQTQTEQDIVERVDAINIGQEGYRYSSQEDTRMGSQLDGTEFKTETKGKGKARPTYRYIGDLYVHGLMQGEGLSLAKDWEQIALV